MGTHILSARLSDASVPRQHPLEPILQQLLHRLCLLRPRVPAGIVKRGQRLLVRVPREVIASKQDFVSIEKYLVSTRVPRRWNDQQIIIDAHYLRARDHLLDAASGGAIPFMHNAPAFKVLGKLCMISDIVLVREEHDLDAAHVFDLARQRRIEPWRVDQYIALWPYNQVRPRAKARL